MVFLTSSSWSGDSVDSSAIYAQLKPVDLAQGHRSRPPRSETSRRTGRSLTVSASGPPSFNLTTQTLSDDGVYIITVDPNGTSTGTITVTVTSP
jgi:hypothetical protein